MTLDEFSVAAHEAFASIPAEFRDGVDGLTIRSEALPHPAHPDVYTLGQCLTEAYPSEWHGPDTLRSVLVLFHGSFRALAENDPDFDWEGELWETLTHELRHHLESLANEDDLEGVDYAMDQAFARAEGEPFDPFYYQSGIEVTPGLYQVEYDFFLEQSWSPQDGHTPEFVEFRWHGSSYRAPRPEAPGDIHYLWVTGVDVGPGSLQLVLVRRRGWRERWKGSRSGESIGLSESEGAATLIPAV